MIRVDVPLAGLPQAVRWCERAMVSPNATRRHPIGVPGAEPPRTRR